MKLKPYFYLIILFIISSCNTFISQNEFSLTESLNNVENTNLINKNNLTIYTKYRTVNGFTRIKPSSDFEIFLNNLPLKADKLSAKLYDGTIKLNKDSYAGIIDLPQFESNIQFHSNAIIRLRAEYYFKNKMYDKIDFKSKSNSAIESYLQYSKGDYSYKKFNSYLEYLLFNITPSTINHMLEPIKIKEIKIGDVFIQRSNTKSHAAIVVDVAQNIKNEKIFILAQSYYPSQDIQIITNPLNEDISPWFNAKEGTILTPEWRFMSSDIMRFID